MNSLRAGVHARTLAKKTCPKQQERVRSVCGLGPSTEQRTILQMEDSQRNSRSAITRRAGSGYDFEAGHLDNVRMHHEPARGEFDERRPPHTHAISFNRSSDR
jgi:hypothetical protein